MLVSCPLYEPQVRQERICIERFGRMMPLFDGLAYARGSSRFQPPPLPPSLSISACTGYSVSARDDDDDDDDDKLSIVSHPVSLLLFPLETRKEGRRKGRKLAVPFLAYRPRDQFSFIFTPITTNVENCASLFILPTTTFFYEKLEFVDGSGNFSRSSLCP